MKKLRICPFCKAEAKTDIVALQADRKLKLRAYCSECRNVEQSVVVLDGCMFARLEEAMNEICNKWNGEVG